LVFHVAVDQRQHFADELVHVVRGRWPALALEHHANAGDHLRGAAAVGDDAPQGRARLVDIGARTREPTQAGLGVGGDCRQRLIDLMHDRS